MFYSPPAVPDPSQVINLLMGLDQQQCQDPQHLNGKL